MDLSLKEYTYTGTTSYKFDNYKFVAYSFESEKVEGGEIEKQHRTETIKYTTPLIIIPF